MIAAVHGSPAEGAAAAEERWAGLIVGAATSSCSWPSSRSWSCSRSADWRAGRTSRWTSWSSPSRSPPLGGPAGDRLDRARSASGVGEDDCPLDPLDHRCGRRGRRPHRPPPAEAHDPARRDHCDRGAATAARVDPVDRGPKLWIAIGIGAVFLAATIAVAGTAWVTRG